MNIAFFEATQLEAVVDAFHEVSRHYFGPGASDRATVRESVIANMLGPDSGVRVVVAAEDGAVAGVATVSILYPAPEERGQLFMKDLYVCEAWRGKGIGEELMRFLARYAVSKNCVRFDWTTEQSNHGARAFYERLGAKHVQEKVYYRLTDNDLLDLARNDPR